MFIACFKVLYQQLYEDTEESHEACHDSLTRHLNAYYSTPMFCTYSSDKIVFILFNDSLSAAEAIRRRMR